MTNLQKNLNGSIVSQNSSVFFPSSVKDADELLKESATLEPLKAVWGSYILENSLIHFPSERGTGKTLLCMQLCLAISSEWDSFCGEKIEKHGNTLLLNFELNEDVIARRIGKLYDTPPLPIKQSKYKTKVFTSRNSLIDELPQISRLIEEIKPIVIFIDNYRLAFMDSDGNSNKDVTRAMNQILSLRDLHKCSIVLVDHTRKNTRNQITESDLQSGAGSKSDLADGDFFLRRSSKDENYRILKRSKSRNCSDQKGAKLLRLDSDSLWFQAKEETVDELAHLGNGINVNTDEKKEIARDLQAKGYSMQQISDMFNVSKSTVSRWLRA